MDKGHLTGLVWFMMWVWMPGQAMLWDPALHLVGTAPSSPLR
ncbi:hypothetical protein N9K98_10145 [Luminiphilus sp.]|jgi:hypothetical protein|nr:hypothetical protein [Luminiphilus sp.]